MECEDKERYALKRQIFFFDLLPRCGISNKYVAKWIFILKNCEIHYSYLDLSKKFSMDVKVYAIKKGKFNFNCLC